MRRTSVEKLCYQILNCGNGKLWSGDGDADNIFISDKHDDFRRTDYDFWTI